VNQTFSLGIVVTCATNIGALAIVLAARGDLETQPRASPASARPRRLAVQKPAPALLQGAVVLRGLGALLGKTADPWLGLLTQLVVFTFFVVSIKRGFHLSVAGRPAQ
jgi:hypothetical protein